MDRPHHRRAGFTLLELLIAVTILVVVAAIGVPQYVSALRTARIGKARQELVTMSHAIDGYTVNNGGRLPFTLYQVGFGGKLDPWGTPYCYLNYSAGTGDGLEWAVAASIVDPGAFGSTGGSGGGGGGVGGLGLPGPLGGSFHRLFDGHLGPSPQLPIGVNAMSVTEARAVAQNLFSSIGRTPTAAELEALIETLTSIGHFDLFTNVAVESTRRRDQYMFPLNTDYDLFSLGPNGRTAVSLGEEVAQDDVIRANNGGYYGPAYAY